MMYSNKLVTAIKVNGKILRENSGVVTLPFGTEYSILLKNLNSVRALVKVSVDGTDATEGTWLILPANGSIDLERFIRNGNFNSGNRFKFIERTATIEDHRGIGAEDGLVRVEYKAEVVAVQQPIVHYYNEYIPIPRPYYPSYPSPWRRPQGPFLGRPQASASRIPTRSMRKGAPIRGASTNFQNSSTEAPRCSYSGEVSAGEASIGSQSMNYNDSGITVPGSESHQQFVTGEWFATEQQSSVMILKLRGEIHGRAVKTAVTVKHKPRCSSCGVVNKGIAEFCSKCGTALHIIA